MIRFLLLGGIEWTDAHQGVVLAAIAALAAAGYLLAPLVLP